MCRGLHLLSTWFAALSLCFGSPPVSADAQGFFLEGLSGIAVPAGDLGRHEKTGSSFELALGYEFGSRVAILGDFGLVSLSGDDIREPSGAAPAVTVRTLTVGVETMLRSPATPLHASVRVGLGAAEVEFESFTVVGAPPQNFSPRGTYPMLRAGLSAGYDFTQAVSVFVRGQALYVMIDRDDTSPLAMISPDVPSVGPSWIIPLMAGLRITLTPRR
jgi:hypothetical protein